MAQKLWSVGTSNAYNTTLNGSIGSADTTITLNSVAGLQTPGVLVIDRQDGSGNNTPALREYISFTGINGNQITGATRGLGGSTAQSHNSGALVEENWSVTHINDLVSFLQNEHDATGKHVISTATISYTETRQLAVTSQASIANLTTQTLIVTSQASISQIFTYGLLSASGASLVGIFPSGVSGTILTSNAPLPPVFAASSASVGTDGWTTVSDTFTYASATSFTISGVDRTTIYQKGTRVKFTNNSITFYGTVISSSFSTNTTVNLLPNTDFSINNSAITAPFYSYQISPQGYPGFFTDTPSVTGFSSFTGQKAIYFIIGNWIRIWYEIDGTSNSTAFTITLPVAAINTQIDAFLAGGVRARDNSSIVGANGAGAVSDIESGTTLQLYKDFSNTGWTNSGSKSARFAVDYKF